MAPTLRPYQLDLIERVRQARIRGARIIVVQAATGAGKTNVAAAFAAAAVEKGKRVFFLVHRRRLVDQISDRLGEFDLHHGVIMRGEHYSSAPIQVASRDTILSRCYTNEWIGLPAADLVILDEAHHAGDPQSEYRRILEMYPAATILLLSATPVGPDGRGMGPWAQAIECAMPTSQLVKGGYLTPVKCYAPARKSKHGKLLKGIAGDLVGSWLEYAENRPTVLFCSRVQHSVDAVEAFKKAGVEAVHVDAETPDDERDQAFDGLSGGHVKVISNVGIVGEGVDIPALSCCQLFCEVSGRVKFLQACGRIMRPSPGKEYGILIDHSGAVFRHGFPDEDTHWTLDGDVDAEFKAKHDKGETEKANYCKHCDLVFPSLRCPQCGRAPGKPPRSIFAPEPVRPTNEILTEADRAGKPTHSRDEKVAHWFRCLGVAASRNGTFAMASVIYKQKYNEWPGRDFPCAPGFGQNKHKVKDVYPKFGRKKEATHDAD